MIAIDGILIDAAEVEGHAFASDVTEDEVEIGSAFTDVIKNKSDSVTIQGIVSDTPVADFIAIRAQATASGLDEELPFLPSDEAQARLLKVHRDQKPVTVQTSRGTWEQMALTSLDIPVDDKTGNTLMFTATFTQIRLRSTTLVVVRVAAPHLGGTVKLAKPGINKATVLKRGQVLTKGDKVATWDPDAGNYRYRDGTLVQPSDLVPPPGATQIPATGEWANPDGSLVTLEQYQRQDDTTATNLVGAPNRTTDASPWYDRASEAIDLIP